MAKKTSVKITGVSQARDNILKFLNNTIQDKQVLNELGQVAADSIRNRTRAGMEEYKQKPLSKTTQERREALIPKNSFDDKIVKPKRSNLSLSGQLLESISFRINNAQALVTLFLYKPRLPYNGTKKSALKNDKDNVQIKNDLESKGRKFFFISEKLNAQLENRITQALRRKLAQYNRLRRKLSL